MGVMCDVLGTIVWGVRLRREVRGVTRGHGALLHGGGWPWACTGF